MLSHTHHAAGNRALSRTLKDSSSLVLRPSRYHWSGREALYIGRESGQFISWTVTDSGERVYMWSSAERSQIERLARRHNLAMVDA